MKYFEEKMYYHIQDGIPRKIACLVRLQSFHEICGTGSLKQNQMSCIRTFREPLIKYTKGYYAEEGQVASVIIYVTGLKYS